MLLVGHGLFVMATGYHEIYLRIKKILEIVEKQSIPALSTNVFYPRRSLIVCLSTPLILRSRRFYSRSTRIVIISRLE
jgi:hypothetical protein